MPIRTLIVEDHEVSRIALKLTLEESGEYDVVGEAGDGFSAVSIAEAINPDLIITELVLPHIGGLDAIEQIRALGTTAPILVLTCHESDDNAAQALVVGADGFCGKDIPKSSLLDALKMIMKGELHFDALQLRRRLGFGAEQTLNHNLPDVVRGFLSGKSISEVADGLSVERSEALRSLRQGFKEAICGQG